MAAPTSTACIPRISASGPGLSRGRPLPHSRRAKRSTAEQDDLHAPTSVTTPLIGGAKADRSPVSRSMAAVGSTGRVSGHAVGPRSETRPRVCGVRIVARGGEADNHCDGHHDPVDGDHVGIEYIGGVGWRGGRGLPLRRRMATAPSTANSPNPAAMCGTMSTAMDARPTAPPALPGGTPPHATPASVPARPHDRDSERASEVLAGEPGQGEVGDFAPSVIEDERVAAVGERVVVGDRA